jgi:lysine/ornithine N-monooxygenase
MATSTAPKNHTYDVVIVGAGPATLGLLTNAVRTNR